MSDPFARDPVTESELPNGWKLDERGKRISAEDKEAAKVKRLAAAIQRLATGKEKHED